MFFEVYCDKFYSEFFRGTVTDFFDIGKNLVGADAQGRRECGITVDCGAFCGFGKSQFKTFHAAFTAFGLVFESFDRRKPYVGVIFAKYEFVFLFSAVFYELVQPDVVFFLRMDIRVIEEQNRVISEFFEFCNRLGAANRATGMLKDFIVHFRDVPPPSR